MTRLAQPPAGDGRRYGYWMGEALAAEPGEPLRTLERGLQADFAIVGGGYVGLWTAIELSEAEPDARIVVLEADLCGSGASGRNGGFAFGWWPKIETLIDRAGEGEALRLAKAAAAAVDELGEFCRDEGIEAAFSQKGWLWTATSAAQIGAWRGATKACARLGVAPFEELGVEEVQRRTGSPVHLGGAFERDAATVQPARLARGLMRAARRRGIEVYERSPVLEIDRGAPALSTAAGIVRAHRVVLATNAWLASVPELRRAIVPLSSDVVATAPFPDALEASGWSGGEAVSDSRLMVHYLRTTDDGRVVLGRGGGGLGSCGRFPGGFDHHRRRARRVSASVRELVPASSRFPIVDSWGGAVDRSYDGLPFFGALKGNRILYGAGFSGNGVVPSLLGGRILRSLALGRQDEWSHSALAKGPPGRFPVEPVRTLGGTLVREAVRRKESLEDRGREAGPLVRALSGFAPSGFFKPDSGE